jgi:phosphoribosylformimino-5-aminoimidazole carboxamide ribotide isomerase
MSKLHLVPSMFITDGKARIVNPISNVTNLADAVDLAVELEEIGFDEIVLVDVDGAKTGVFNSFDILNEISALTQFDILAGGGIRDEITVEKAFNAGASRVLLNTLPASDREMMLRLVDAYGNNSFVIGLDSIDNGIVIKGRSKSDDISIEEMIGFYLEVGIDRYILQTLNNEGNKIPPDPGFYQTVKSVFYNARIYAGEGLDNYLQFEQFEDSGIEGLILGDDFYTNEQLFIELKKYIFD